MRERHFNTAQNQKTVYQSTDRFYATDKIPQGYLVIKDNQVPIDMYYKSKNSDTTVVCFHGAVEKEVRLPWLIGSGVLKYAGANRLSISDPTLFLHDDVQIGWFAGNSDMPDLHRTLEALIRKVIEATGTKHVIFFGGSAGGFAALAMSRHFPGSLALPMNPQTSIQKFFSVPVGKYVSNAWPELPTLEDAPDSVPHDLTREYACGHENTVAFIQNQRDLFHIKNHQKPYFEVLNRDLAWTLRGVWGTASDNGHVTPPREVTARVLNGVCTAKGAWGKALDTLGFTPGV
ncbi:alpha/beta fold hydrolase [Glutamicibacter sp. AOP3-A1-12]|uniref:alpha/beta fold hydrolase n=1 Tax=Glutamicibacter sp. AOP3-A1-12 TaxID=3457701 RepID=UPI00403327B0